MFSEAAYLLVAHGSRDPRSRQSLSTLADLLTQALVRQPARMAASPAPSRVQIFPFVRTATLEFGPCPLADQIHQAALQASTQGWAVLNVIPLFLLPGTHVSIDLPEAMQQAQVHWPTLLKLHRCPYIGSYPGLHELVRSQMQSIAVDRWILLAHGSRRSEANQFIANLAQQLGAAPAYWATPHSLETQIQALFLEQASKKIGIFPYFLFTGSIIDAIQAQTYPLRSRFPDLDLTVTQPLGPSPALARVLLDAVGS